MRIKLDENLPVELVTVLREQGHDVDTVPDEGIGGAPDEAVWAAVSTAGRFLITQDLDFSDRRRFVPGTHAGILLLRRRQPSRRALIEHVRWLFHTEPVESFARCFVVATETKIRVLRPESRG
jgi:predicted nuclease of predicted toxin-antitoxin system